MRLDKYLKVSRIIKRRTVANEACSAGRVTINDKVAKPSTEVGEGDIISIRFGAKTFTAEVLSVREYATKENADAMYRVISNE
jgi:ribosomal 50S subunit-recycling heat shock protein